MSRVKLIDRLVARKLKSLGKAKVFCVPCLGSTSPAPPRRATQPKK